VRVGSGVLGVGLAVLLTVCGACSGPSPREVTLIARGMTFEVDGQGDASNPVIKVAAGERVRLVLRNEAPGLLHDVAIPAWNVAVDPIRAGETTEVTFTAPHAPGRAEYHCRPHAELMNGFVEVSP
jgi:plastocyanin